MRLLHPRDSMSTKSSAAVLHATTDADDLRAAAPATIEELSLPDPAGDEVLVEVTAASLCHTDVAIARGHIPRPTPLAMGHEGAGVVRAVGPAVTTVEPGDSVVLGRTTCGRCPACRAGAGQHCEKRTAAHRSGTLRDGQVRFGLDGDPVHHCHGVSSFGEHTLVTEEVAIEVPSELPPREATVLGCGVFTGVGAATNTARVEAGSSVVVFGAGGVGLSTVQGARLCGASDIVCVDVVREKLDVARSVGATHAVDASDADPVERVRELVGGVDYAFDVVGNPRVTEQAVGCLAPMGSAVLVGVPPAGPQSLDLDLYDLVTSEKEILGSFNGSFTLPLAIPKLADLAVAGHLDLGALVTDVKPLDRVNDAMADMEEGAGIRQVIEP